MPAECLVNQPCIEPAGREQPPAVSPGRPDRERIRAILAVVPADVETILDAGCGRGWICDALAGRYGVVALDRRVEALAQVGSPAVGGDLASLPFKDRSFDLVLCCEVLEHIADSDLGRVLRELLRVARKYILVTVPNGQDLETSLCGCPRCKRLFNPVGHVRSFGAVGLACLFNGLGRGRVQCISAKEVFRERRRREVRCMRRLSPQWNGFWSAGTRTTCPACGFQRHGRDRMAARAWRASYRALKLVLDPLGVARGRWLSAVYRVNADARQQERGAPGEGGSWTSGLAR